MATDLGQSRATPPAKYEAFVTAQLARAERRIRTLDLATALLGFLTGTTVFALLMTLCDRGLNLSDGARQFAFAAYLLGAAAYVGLTVVRPMRRRVNPYFAARRVEATLPGAKNSVVNWLDLQQTDVPPVIRGALGQRAARDLGRADLEQAISGRRAKWAGLLAGALAGVLLALIFFQGAGPFFFRLGRVFAPFAIGGPAPTRTQLTLLQPPEGDATVTVGRPVTFVVRVDGTVPDPRKADALKLLFRYREDEPYQERPLVPDSGREWSVSVPAIDVQSGFWYRVAGGDAVTPEYRVRVRSTPLVTDFLATYQFPAYTARPEVVRRERKLEALVGTRVVLKVRTNRELKDAGLDFDRKNNEGREKVPGERLADEPTAFRVVLPLEQSGQYRLRFTAADGETYLDPLAYPVVVTPDLPPTVELTKPGKDVQLPANGVLQLEGQASDDIGVKSLTLRMSLLGGIRLQPKNYRSDDKIRLPHGGYPTSLAYKDFVELAKLKDSEGKPVKLQKGDTLEYWLEASDACDRPRPNVSESKHYRVQIVEASKDDRQQQQEVQQAQDEQKQHEKSQDQQIQQEDKERQDAAEQQNQQNQEESAKDQQPKDGGDGKPGDKDQGTGNKDGKDGKDDKTGSGNGEKGDKGKDEKPGASDGSGNPADTEQQKKDEQTKQQADRLQEAINKLGQEQKNGEKGEGKGDPKPGDGTGKGEGKPEQAPQPGEAKPEGQPGADKQAGEGKEGPKPGDKREKPSEGKGAGTPNPMQDNKAEAKGGSPMKDQAEGKGEGTPMQPPSPAEAKGGGSSPEGQKDAGKEKPESQGSPQKPVAEGQAKDAGPGGKTADGRPAGEKKDQPQPAEKSEGKAGDKTAGGETQAAPKGDKSSDPTPRAEAKPDSTGGGKEGSRAEAKPDKAPSNAGGKGEKMKPESVTPRDVEQLAKDLDSSDPRKREQAAEQLAKAKDLARDAEAREAARKELEKHGLNPDGKAGKPAPQDATPRDAEQLAKDLKSDDAGKREDAAKQLEKMKDLARDPATREAARKELEKNGRGAGDDKIAQGKPQTPEGTSDGKKPESPAEAKGGAGDKKQETGTAKASDPKGEGQSAEGKDGPRQEGKVADAKEMSSDATKVPTGRRDGDGPDGVEPPVLDAKPKEHRAGVIQLEDIRKNINKDVLKAANMTEEQYREWEKAARELNQRLQAEAKSNDVPAAPQTGGGLATTGGKRTDPGAKGQPGEVRNGGKVQPPPDYRDGWSEFTRKKKAAENKDKQ
jgi:hypothetical protein